MSAPQFSEAELVALEAEHAQGLSTQQVVELFASRGERMSEATFRKYVQLGLLPRSVRVGRKGKHRGSQGLYPATVVRQIDLIRGLQAQGHTIDAIKREFVGVRGEIDAVARQLAALLSMMEQAMRGSAQGAAIDEIVSRELASGRQLADALVSKLRAIEERLAMRSRMARAAV